MSSVITYLFFGVLWDVILHFISTITEGNNELSTKERIFSLVLCTRENIKNPLFITLWR